MREGWYAIGEKRRHYAVPMEGDDLVWALCKHWLVDCWRDVRIANPQPGECCAECKRKLARRLEVKV